MRRRSAYTEGPSVDDLRAEALARLDEDEVEQALGMAREAVRRAPDAESHYVLGVALSADGATDDAVAALERAVALDVDHADAWVALGWERLDQLGDDPARVAATTALRIDGHHPDALLLRAALRERRGDLAGADRDLQAAALVAPDTCPLPPPLDDDAVASLADEVIATMHPSVQRALQDVHILVHEVPDDELLVGFDPPMRPTELLGCITGPTLEERSVADAWSALPTTILLFRRNLQRMAHDADELREELRITLLHEIGHYLGLDEAELEERGLG